MAVASAVGEESLAGGGETAATLAEELSGVGENERGWSAARLVAVGMGMGDWELEMRRNVTKMSKRKKANTKGYFFSFKILGTDRAAICMKICQDLREREILIPKSNWD